MIEKNIMDYLVDCGFDAFCESPPNPPDTYVVVDKIAEREESKMRFCTIAIQSNAPTMLDAMELNDEITDCMLNIVALRKYGSCKLDNSYPYTNTQLKQYRYQSVFEIVYYR